MDLFGNRGRIDAWLASWASSRVLLEAVLAVCFLLLLRSPNAAEANDAKPLWLVVSREQFLSSLKPLIEKRRLDGFEVLVSTAHVGKSLAAAPRLPNYLLLVGDDEAGAEQQPWHLPAKRRKLYHWEHDQPESFASDTAWGDVDGDLVPDMAVGRIPARTPRDVEVVVNKILAFESQQPSERDLQLLVWAGSPMFGALIDKMAIGVLLSSLQSGSPGWVRLWIIAADPSQPYCGWPPDQPSRFCRRMRQGWLCQIVIGHGTVSNFLYLFVYVIVIQFVVSWVGDQLAEG
ncbi:MAG: C25 family cysteine peptidase, partial [Planctomycetota bacterium]|nr:C25 family cysteine peptidase [Planctomycetota bacterium]